MATPRFSVSTPSPPPNIHTPPSPKFGFGDSWQPFSPRKSSRLASKSASVARTPSPSAGPRRAANAHPHLLRSPRASKSAAAAQGVAVVPAATPRKKRMATASTPESVVKRKVAESQATHAGLGMLPTPAKTPSKKQHAASQNESNIAAIARNLFHTDVDEVMSSPSGRKTRRPKKYTGISLESFTVVEEDETIPIFTDSQDRVPEPDHSTDNPFYGDGASQSSPPVTTPRRRSKRTQVSIPGEGHQSVEEASRREDGIVYVFRGKKIFRKFEDSAAAQDEDALDLPASKRLTRSSIKPRLLFPPNEARETAFERPHGGDTTEDDEEAVTDIEDNGAHETKEEEADEVMTTPADLVEKTAPNTPPNAPRFAPVSPPITGRTTRSGHRAVDAPSPVKTAKKRSPFDGWRQTKSSSAAAATTAAGKKRPADALGSPVSGAAAKRSRV